MKLVYLNNVTDSIPKIVNSSLFLKQATIRVTLPSIR